jgi:acetylglutamate kinase
MTLHDEGPLVVKIGGGALDGETPDAALMDALAGLIARETRQVVIVHGGGSVVDAHIRRVGLEPTRRDGIRITPKEHIGEVVAVLAGRINKAVVGGLRRAGAPGVGLCLADAGLDTALDTSLGFDAGRVGTVTGGDALALRVLLDAGLAPVICSIGIDADGEALNVNADTAAAGVACALGASELLLLTDVAGILDASDETIDEIDVEGIDELIATGVVRNGMVPKARAGAHAASTIGAPVTIASWRDPESLRILCEGGRTGTRVVCGAVRRRMPEARPV